MALLGMAEVVMSRALYLSSFWQPNTRHMLTYWKESRGPPEGQWGSAHDVEVEGEAERPGFAQSGGWEVNEDLLPRYLAPVIEQMGPEPSPTRCRKLEEQLEEMGKTYITRKF